ncbi:HNH endonuclease [Clostridium perfringens]|uniref:HNH endonuclease n=1 Tax=Clostridium perfringens TaxID=1502 RepID=UPI0028709346|nr:HNH endonuclease [Clostridium perfringens]MDU7725415.1 HNH endonuclease [Clostridium perfringens]
MKLAKDAFKKKYGKLKCEICGFDFESKYGKIGENFIEGHNIKLVSELQDEDVTKKEDIVLLCSNCHRMIHRRRPWLSKEELELLIDKNIKVKEIENDIKENIK